MDKLKTPDFLIVGAQKSGTTTLHYALSSHKNVFMSDPKELNFFQDDKNYIKGKEWYSQYFERCGKNQLAGESSPEYFHYPVVPKRIATMLPNAKIIILLRNPIDRAYSAYWHAVRHAGEHLKFERAIEIEGKRVHDNSHAEKYYSYVSRGHYVTNIKEFFKCFPRDKIEIVIAEEYFQNPAAALEQISKFLSIDLYTDYLDIAQTVLQNKGRAPKSIKIQRIYAYLKRHLPFLEYYFPTITIFFSKLNRATEEYPQLTPQTRALLWNQFNDSICELEKLIGRKIMVWNQGKSEIAQ